jgi:NADH-quinone oxidoreductase subunit M
VVATAGVVLAVLYLFWAYQRVFHGAPSGDNAHLPDMTWRERAVMVPLLIAIVFIGVHPKPLLDRIGPSVNSVIDNLQTPTTYRPPTVSVGAPNP